MRRTRRLAISGQAAWLAVVLSGCVSVGNAESPMPPAASATTVSAPSAAPAAADPGEALAALGATLR